MTKKIIALVFALCIAAISCISAFATDPEIASKFDVVTKPAVGDDVADVNSDLAINGYFKNSSNEDQILLEGHIFAGSPTESITWVKEGTSTPLTASDTFTAGTYNVTIIYHTELLLPSASTKYYFNGAEASSATFENGELVMTGKVKVGAEEKDIDIQVSLEYNKNCEDTVTGFSEKTTVNKGSNAIVVPALSRSNYAFKEWNTKADGTGTAYKPNDNITVNTDTVLYAIWQKDNIVKYTITFDAGSVKTFDKAMFGEGETIKFPETSVTGYTFKGWFTDSEFKTEFKDTKMPGKDITIYAKYIKNSDVEYTLTVVSGLKTETSKHKAGEAIEVTGADTVKYHFEGIFEDEACTKLNTYKTMPEKDLTLYALYSTKLSKLDEELKNYDMKKTITDLGITEELFEQTAKALGYSVSYSINGKSFKPDSIMKFKESLVKDAKENIPYGTTKAVNITVKMGKNNQETTLNVLVYNDIKEEPTVTEPDTKTDKPTEPTKADEPTSEPAPIDNNVPDTGSTAIDIAAFTAISVAVAAAFVCTKKKENLN